jgi:hypothetical protein
MNNHYICKVWDLTNPHTTPTHQRYFDGTQPQALRFFKSEPMIKKYLKNANYSVYVRANSIDLKQIK